MKVLVACEFSGIVREAFRKRGHDAWSCDLLDTEIPGQHIIGDVLEILDKGWDLMIAHPPCTYLTNAGVRHLHEHCTSSNGNKAKVFGKARFIEMEKGALFFQQLLKAPIPRIAIENPTPHRYAIALIGPYQQAFQPWQFGNPETKRTCLWLKGLPPLMSPLTVVGNIKHSCHKYSPSTIRWKLRSRTYQGVADAMANQWG